MVQPRMQHRLKPSKVFSKNLMKEFHIPTAAYEVFDDPAESAVLHREESVPGGHQSNMHWAKGHKYYQSRGKLEGLHEIMEEKVFAPAQAEPEVSVLAFLERG